MQPGEIYLASFPFGDVATVKLRPVLVLTPPIGSVPEIVVAYISSVVPSRLLNSDILLEPAKPAYASTRLKTTSLLRLHKLATLHAASFQRYIGVVSPNVWKDVEAKLCVLLNL